jgi:hypothetical protein
MKILAATIFSALIAVSAQAELPSISIESGTSLPPIGIQPLPQIGVVAPANRPSLNNYLNAEADRADAEAAYIREKVITERAGIYAENPQARGIIGMALESERNARQASPYLGE